MKKKVLFLSVLCASAGLGLAVVGGIKGSNLMVCAEEGSEPTTSEVVPTEEPQVNEDSGISQTCKDCIEFIKQFFSQPLVIGGVSTTVGALAILIISKAICGASKKKVSDLKRQLEDLVAEMGEYVGKKDYNSMKATQDKLCEVLKEIVPTIKNINVRKECEQLLVELEPVKEDVKEFAENVVKETKVECEKVSSEIMDILKD